MSRDFLKFPKVDDAEVIITANATANKIMKIIVFLSVVFEKTTRILFLQAMCYIYIYIG